MIRIAVCDDERCFTEQIDHIIANHARDITPPPETVLYTSSGQLLYDCKFSCRMQSRPTSTPYRPLKLLTWSESS